MSAVLKPTSEVDELSAVVAQTISDLSKLVPMFEDPKFYLKHIRNNIGYQLSTHGTLTENMEFFLVPVQSNTRPTMNALWDVVVKRNREMARHNPVRAKMFLEEMRHSLASSSAS